MFDWKPRLEARVHQVFKTSSTRVPSHTRYVNFNYTTSIRPSIFQLRSLFFFSLTFVRKTIRMHTYQEIRVCTTSSQLLIFFIPKSVSFCPTIPKSRRQKQRYVRTHVFMHLNQNPADPLTTWRTFFRYGVSRLLAAALSSRRYNQQREITRFRKASRRPCRSPPTDRPFLTICRKCENGNENKTESVLKSDFETTFLGAPEISSVCPHRSQARSWMPITRVANIDIEGSGCARSHLKPIPRRTARKR